MSRLAAPFGRLTPARDRYMKMKIKFFYSISAVTRLVPEM